MALISCELYNKAVVVLLILLALNISNSSSKSDIYRLNPPSHTGPTSRHDSCRHLRKNKAGKVSFNVSFRLSKELPALITQTSHVSFRP